jgi:predicted ester cyclase
MDKLDIVKSVLLGSDNPDKAAVYADDFQLTDSVGGPPMDKSTWLGMELLILASFPDMEYVIEEIKEEGDGVRLAGHFIGTFTNDLDLSAMGIGVIPASGKKITWASSSELITVEGNKITRWHSLNTGPDAGMAGFLRPLGVG